MSQPLSPLAIVGMACLFPKADGLNAYWANVKRGVDGITPVPASHWDPADYFDADPKKADFTYAQRGGFLDPVPFDAAAYGIAPATLEATDASQLLGLVVASEALKNAGYGPDRAFDRNRASVILGVTGTLQLAIPLGARLGHPHWKKALADCGIDPETAQEVMDRIADAYVPWQENSFPGLLGNVVAGRIANRLDLGGTNCVVDAACGSSLSAMNLAVLELATGKADMVVTGGVDAFNDIFMYMCFSKTPALSPTGDSRPFSNTADGTILGEGLGMVVLKRLADAERDGDHIHCVLKSIGTSSDGRGKAIYAPSDDGQEQALRAAYREAGVTPDTIELVEAHGTGTKVGDAIELAALTRVYREARPEGRWVTLGSVKSQIGHTKAAAGAAGLIKAALALEHKVLPPTIKVERPAEALEGTPFSLNAAPRPWLPRAEHPRRAAVSAFGFGGSNFHAVLEEYRPAKLAPDWDGRVDLLALSAATRQGVEQLLERHLAPMPRDERRLACQQARAAFDPKAQCRLVVVLDGDDPVRVLNGARTQLREGKPSWSTPDGAFYGEGAAPGKLAVLFPGQGAQYPGMGRDLACLFPAALDALAEAQQAFEQGDLLDHMIPPTAYDDAGRQAQADRLRATDVAQPALGACGLATWRVLAGFGLQPAAFAGHSYGELAALCAAGRLSPAELHKLSNLRGRLMAGSGGDRGAMLAVRAPLAMIEALVKEQGLDVVLANKNAPKQGVLSGSTAAIEAAKKVCDEAGLEATRLVVGAAFHSPLVADAEAPLLEALQGMALPAGGTVYANTTAAPYPADAAAARALLAGQLARPVEWVAQVQAMAADGVHTFLEVAPGARLTGLVKASLEGKPHVALAVDASNGKRDGVADLARALAQLAALGHALDLAGWQGGAEGVRAIAERKPPKMAIPISGANHRAARPQRPPLERRPAPAPAPVPAPAEATRLNGNHPTPTPAAAPLPAPTPAPALPAPVAAVQAPAPPAGESPLLVEALRASQESLVALQRLQEQTARLHAQYLQGQEVTQQSFMALIERQQQLFGAALGLATPGALPALPVTPPTAPAPALAAPLVAASVVAGPVAPAPVVATPVIATPVAPAPAAAAPVAAAPVVPALVVPAPVVPAPTAPAKGGAAITPVLLAVVAEKTGYPTDMLGLEMSLEADLGIDSIKRVEILSAIQEKLPNAPVIKPDQLGTLVTLADVAAHLSSPLAGEVAEPEGAPSPVKGEDAVRAVLIEVVAEKTGYPTDMLGLEMSLEADLGIDSIKRVEILSAIQERLPNAPVIKPDQLGALVTPAAVAGHLAVGAPAATPMPAPAPAAATIPAPVTAPATVPAVGIEAAVIAIVAEKTGYPTEMLEPDMTLEADLGIDSIKRVEILSAVQEALPAAPVVKPDQIGTITTLRQLIAHLEAPAREATRVVPAAPAPVVVAPVMVAPVVVAPVVVAPVAVEPPAPVAAPAPVMPAPVEVDPATDAPNWEPISGLQRMILRAVPLPASPEREAGKLPFGAEVWVADDGAALGQALHDRLGALGFKVRRIELANEAGWPEPGPVAGLFIVADALALEGPVWGRARERFLAAALHLTQRVEPALRKANGALVTVSRLDGGFGLLDLDADADATAGGLAGLAKTAGLEWPEVACQAIDVDRDWKDDAAIAADLVRELFLDGPAEVGLRANERLALSSEETPIVPPAVGVPVRPGELVVVTGGARGVTAEAAVALARYARPTLVLFGRSPAPTPEPAWLAGQDTEAGVKAALLADARAQGGTPTPRELEEQCRQALANREVLRTLARIEAEGGQAIYRQLDVRDARAVAGAIAELRAAHGPVRGLVHGAGVLADRRIGDLTREQIDAVLATKVEGLRHLLAAIGDDELRVLALFSSITGRRGRVGQVAYAIANEVLDKVAQQQARRRPNCRVTAINWGPWDGGMVTPALKRMFADEGVGVVPLDAGAELLVQELAQPAGAAVEVLVLGAPPAPATSAPRPLANLDDRPPRMQTAFSRWLSPKQYPFLTSHVMNGRAVLPVAVMVEWLAHGALHANPGLAFHGIEDLRVFKGVILAEDAPYGIRVAASPARRDTAGRQRVLVELRGTGENDVLHARAHVLLVTGELPAPPAQPPAWPSQGAYPRSVADAYNDVLFHGPDFRGVAVVERCAADGIAAEVMVAPPPRAWIESPLRDAWLADPLALDAAFQLLILWSVEHLDAPCLPSIVESYQQFRPGFPADGVTVVVKVAERRASQVRAEVAFLDRTGHLVAQMRAECTSDAGLAEAFRRNELTLQP